MMAATKATKGERLRDSEKRCEWDFHGFQR